MRVLGLSSGTSVDAIDVALAEFTHEGDRAVLQALGHLEVAWQPELRADLLAALPPGRLDVGAWCRFDTLIGQAFGEAAARGLAELGPADLVASHGQTLFHWVEDGRARGSLQVGNPAWIHERVGLPVVHDLRVADIAAGGQGAPLVSLLDAMWLGERPTAALNLGGIANLTLVGDGGVVCGDTGPANCLVDAVMGLRGQRCDLDGRAAAAGRVQPALLDALLAEPYFARPMPKSTGREYFHLEWVHGRIGEFDPHSDDLVATLTELTARTIADQLHRHPVDRLVVSGGGAQNPHLLARIAEHCGRPVVRARELGVPDEAKEAYLFALLGWFSMQGWPGTVAAGDGHRATGARAPRVLGSLTPVAPLGGPAPTRLVVHHPEPGRGRAHD